MKKRHRITLILDRKAYRRLKKAAKRVEHSVAQFVYESADDRARAMKRGEIGFRA